MIVGSSNVGGGTIPVATFKETFLVRLDPMVDPENACVVSACVAARRIKLRAATQADTTHAFYLLVLQQEESSFVQT